METSRSTEVRIRVVAFSACSWLLALSIASCRTPDPAGQCPATFVEDAPRATRLWKRLEDVRIQGIRSLHAPSKPRVCFGQTYISTITTEGVIYFDDKLDEMEGAARLGHLFMHFVDGMPMADPQPTDCEAQVDKALRAESMALSFELQLRREFAVKHGRIAYEFEMPYWAAKPEQREQLVFDYLQTHPNGAPGIDGLAAGYAKRCRESVQK